MYGKVPKMPLQKFFRTECAGQVYNFTYVEYGCTSTAVLRYLDDVSSCSRSRTAVHVCTAVRVHLEAVDSMLLLPYAESFANTDNLTGKGDDAPLTLEPAAE